MFDTCVIIGSRVRHFKITRKTSSASELADMRRQTSFDVPVLNFHVLFIVTSFHISQKVLYTNMEEKCT